MGPPTNGSNVYSTPSKDSRQQFPQSGHPSPMPLKHSSSSTSTSSSGNHLNSNSTSGNALTAPAPVITVDSVLKQNATASDPKGAALDQVVAERNSLSAQNAQLWKLIEKQRTGYSQILKELERIRAERDSYKSKLTALTGVAVDKSSRPKESSKPGSSSSKSRTNGSDDAATPRQSSRTEEPVRPSLSDTELQSNASNATQIPARPVTPPRPPPSSAPSALSTPASASRSASRPSPTPLVVPTRSESPAIPSSAISINADNAPFARRAQTHDDQFASSNGHLNGTAGQNQSAYPPRKASIADSTFSQVSSASSLDYANPTGSANVTTPTPYNYPGAMQGMSSQKEESYSPNNTASLDTPTFRTAPPSASQEYYQRPPANRSHSSDRQAPVHPHVQYLTSEASALSRDSRITLPDEARHYITNMADSPAGSPRTNAFNTKPAAQPDNASLTSQGGKSEFLDLDEEDEESEDETRQGPQFADNSAGIRVTVQQGPTTPTSNNFSRSTQSLDLATETTPSRPRKVPTRGGTEEFSPQPGSYPPRQQLSVHPDGYSGMHMGGAQEASPTKQLQSPTDHPSNPVHQDTLNSSRGYNSSSKVSPGPPHHHDMTQQPGSQTGPPPVSASFRALPLLSTDLPHTAIQVSHSFVRPNDRGKEVLSFIVSVNPGHGKPGWKVEKMYSDVLTLDQRVRQSVGKNVGKKIANLPEGKLWKDHAPAKVDQRKAVLEQYLQSLIQLPIKSNDEVIAFFTSDIVRDLKQAVMQVGHKEGYLTKRGKNFGGWKTRFFVLQGPVLDYYDCRGGQQLGSIQITGAQIARQQRKENAPVDEDNEYRHAFLIVEAKKGPGGSHPRHVLCAESDEERDSWVELLVRYHSGSYNEDFVVNPSPGMSSVNSNSVAAASSPIQPRASTSSNDSGQRKQRPPLNMDEYTQRPPSPSRSVDPSPIDRNGAAAAFHDAQMRRIASNGTSGSLPDPSPLSAIPPMPIGTPVSERAASELGHYPDLQAPPGSARQRSPERHRPREIFEGRHNNYSASNLSTSQQAPPDRAPSPEKPDLSKVKISGPMGGTLIPSGFKFGKESNPEPTTSSADRREKAKSRGFWGFGKASGGNSAAADKHPNFVPRAVFAIPLEESLEVAQICGLPAIVFRCIEYLEAKKADQEEGIYRLSGSSAVIKSLKDRFNLEGDVNLLASDEFWDPHAIAGLLKSFLRDLPASILTREMHLRFLAVIDLTDAQERIKELAQLIGALPIANYTILRALTAHLILIVQNAHVNKMTMRNVGIVFSPTLGIPAGVFSLMLAEFNRVFNVDQDDDVGEEEPPSDDPSAHPSAHLSEPVRRNSKRYSDQAADKLLGLSGRSLKAGPPAEEAQSDVDEFSIHEDSGTDGDGGADDSSSGQGSAGMLSPPDTPMAPRGQSKASSTAANRGLNVTVTNSERGNRHSKLIGLPTSPRPSASPSRSQEP